MVDELAAFESANPLPLPSPPDKRESSSSELDSTSSVWGEEELDEEDLLMLESR